MKKIILILLLIICLSATWILFAPFTRFTENSTYIYIRTGETSSALVIKNLEDNQCIKQAKLFRFTADILNIWPRIKPGKYEIKKNQSLFHIIRTLRNNQQTPVNLVITKLRTPNQLAALIEKKFECDSLKFIRYINDSNFNQTYQISATQLLFIAHPNTYTYYWAASPEALIKKLFVYHQQFWNTVRMKKARNLGLMPLEITTLASIVDEETLANEEKPIIAGVYLNRLKKSMPLGADPTVKFATGDFQLKRILLKHIKETATSPYNTYTNKGLPPGPICTPMDETIDAVLNATAHEFLFFCAAPGYTGRHNFAATDKEHLKNARAYQSWLNEKGIR
jgi:UPF0755 protein